MTLTRVAMNVTRIEMHEIDDSTCIAAIGYADSDLYLTFRGSDRTYCYKDVPADVMLALALAESKGHYFLANIRDTYEATRC